jgi:hypothetical protein
MGINLIKSFFKLFILNSSKNILREVEKKKVTIEVKIILIIISDKFLSKELQVAIIIMNNILIRIIRANDIGNLKITFIKAFLRFSNFKNSNIFFMSILLIK